MVAPKRNYSRHPKRVTRRGHKFTAFNDVGFVRASAGVGLFESAIHRVGNAILGGDFGGNARGENAIDLQVIRYNPEDVASGDGSVVFATSGRAAGVDSVAIGDGVSVDADYGLAVGFSAQVLETAARGVAIGYSAFAESNDEAVIAGTVLHLQLPDTTKLVVLTEANYSSYVDLSTKVSKSGDTMTGNLTFSGAGGVELVTFDTPGTAKGRLATLSGIDDWLGLTINANFSGGWNLDRTARDGWFYKLDARDSGDSGNNGIWFFRIPSGANPHSDEYAVFGVTDGTIYAKQKLDVNHSIQLTQAPGGGDDTNLLYLGSTAYTLGFIAGTVKGFSAANGAYFGARGNTYSDIANQRGEIFFSAGNPSTPTSTEGRIVFLSGNDVLRVIFDKDGNVVLAANGALATNATNGFTYIPTSAGAPTGTPTSYTGAVAMQYDTNNNKLFIFNGAWKSVTLA